MQRHACLGLLRPLLLLLLLQSLLLPAVHAQYVGPSASPSAAPTPAPVVVENRTLSDVTPNRDTLVSVLGTDAATEVNNDDDVANVASFEWAVLENDTTTLAPFLICANGGREGVETLLDSGIPRAQVLPLVNDGDRTCFVFHETATNVLDLTTTHPELEFATPLPAIFKVAKGLFRKVHSNAYLRDRASCEEGIRIVMAPGFGQYKKNLNELLSKVKQDFRTGAYRTALATGFYWLAANSTLLEEPAADTTRMHGPNNGHRRRRPGITKVLHVSTPSSSSTTPPPTPFDAAWERDADDRAHGHPHRDMQGPLDSSDGTPPPTPAPEPPPPALTDRGQKWQERINAALSGNFSCNFSSLRIQVDMPYVTLTGVCGLNNGTTFTSLNKGSSCLLALLAYVTTLPSVMYIEPYPVVRTSNWDAAGIGQSGSAYQTPFWGAGLLGQDQVVAVADTGLDVQNCYFQDSAAPLTVDDTSVFTTLSAGAFNNTQRKVVQYVAAVDNVDVKDGHGTHVCGTLAGYREGSPVGGNNNYNGVVPEAKISFYDIGDANGTLSVPSNLVGRLFPPGVKAGARVFSLSWGTNSNAYTYLDVQIDQFMARNRETLVVVAVGNNGQLGVKTAYSPALTKNGIGVGASLSITARPSPNVSSVAHFSSVGPTADGRIKPDIVAPGALLTSADAGSACGTLTLQGTSMATPVVAGLATLVRQYFMEGWYPTGLKTAANAFNPSGKPNQSTPPTHWSRTQRPTPNPPFPPSTTTKAPWSRPC